jgi:hypothetical protein
MTAIKPAVFGSLEIDEDGVVSAFSENLWRARLDQWFSCSGVRRSILSRRRYGLGANPRRRVAAGRELVAYRHTGFWQPVDLREKNLLKSLRAKLAHRN